MIGYKGTDKNLQCRGMQYEVGKTYTVEGEIALCKNGLHFCENLLDVFEYYPPAESRYLVIEAEDVADKQNEYDNKRVCRTLKVIEEIGLDGIVLAAEAGAKDREEPIGDQSVVKSAVTQSIATNTRCQSIAANAGYESIAINTGYRSIATNTGDQSVAGGTKGYSVVTNTGERSVAINTGDYSVAINTGAQSIAVNNGDDSAASVEDGESVAISLGECGKAKGGIGCWLVLAEWSADGEFRTNVRVVHVDGTTIKENTYYTLQNDEFVEAE